MDKNWWKRPKWKNAIFSNILVARFARFDQNLLEWVLVPRKQDQKVIGECAATQNCIKGIFFYYPKSFVYNERHSLLLHDARVGSWVPISLILKSFSTFLLQRCFTHKWSFFLLKKTNGFSLRRQPCQWHETLHDLYNKLSFTTQRLKPSDKNMTPSQIRPVTHCDTYTLLEN